MAAAYNMDRASESGSAAKKQGIGGGHWELSASCGVYMREGQRSSFRESDLRCAQD
jgi:hypothetical protein